MLQELSIRNFAIIDDLKVSFSNGLSVLTGETGAGKSIILNAVNLLLGSRASTKLIRTGAESAELEAMFLVSKKSPVNEITEELQIDIAEGLMVRRVISRNDKHRIYINGRLGTIQMLGRLTEHLASIAGQHAHQKLLKEDQHLLVLDQFAGLMPLRRSLFDKYQAMLPMLEILKKLTSRQQGEADHRELLFFQRKEIIEAELKPDEDVALEQERTRLKHAALLAQTAHDGLDALYHSPGAVLERVSMVKKSIEKAVQIDDALSTTGDLLEQATFQIEDVVQALQTYLNQIHYDDARLTMVEDRLDQLHMLKRKYGGSLDAVASYLADIDQELSSLDTLAEDIVDTEKKLDGLYRELATVARELSQKRNEACARLSKQIEKNLASLNMPHTRFAVSLNDHVVKSQIDDRLTVDGRPIHDTGLDQATFLIAPNKGEELKPLAAIASGGELSRVVLALKAILAQNDAVESIVFDEVDAGIGGGTAEVVGQKLASLAKFHQIICITHLPQIAKFADNHFKISKQVVDDRTKTRISPISKEDRIAELARMLGGVTITEATLEHAREMLEG